MANMNQYSISFKKHSKNAPYALITQPIGIYANFMQTHIILFAGYLDVALGIILVKNWFSSKGKQKLNHIQENSIHHKIPFFSYFKKVCDIFLLASSIPGG